MEMWNSCQLVRNVNWLELRNNQLYASEPCSDTLNEDWWIISCAFLLYSCPTRLRVIIHVRKQQGISSVTVRPCASRLIWESCRLSKSQDWSEVRYRKADLCFTGSTLLKVSRLLHPWLCLGIRKQRKSIIQLHLGWQTLSLLSAVKYGTESALLPLHHDASPPFVPATSKPNTLCFLTGLISFRTCINKSMSNADTSSLIDPLAAIFLGSAWKLGVSCDALRARLGLPYCHLFHFWAYLEDDWCFWNSETQETKLRRTLKAETCKSRHS